MSETGLEETADRQRRTIEESQQLFTQTAELPFRQLVDLQLSTARAFMSGLELTNAAQRMGLDVTRSMVGSYVDALQGTTPGGSQPGGQQQYAPQQSSASFQPAQSGGQPQQASGRSTTHPRQQMQPPQPVEQPPGGGAGQFAQQQPTRPPTPPAGEASVDEQRDEQLPHGPM